MVPTWFERKIKEGFGDKLYIKLVILGEALITIMFIVCKGLHTSTEYYQPLYIVYSKRAEMFIFINISYKLCIVISFVVCELISQVINERGKMRYLTRSN